MHLCLKERLKLYKQRFLKNNIYQKDFIKKNPERFTDFNKTKIPKIKNQEDLKYNNKNKLRRYKSKYKHQYK